MAQRVFVKVLGFSAAERHALNTLFRLSEQRETVYSLWEPQAPEPPRLALVDGRSQEAHQESRTGGQVAQADLDRVGGAGQQLALLRTAAALARRDPGPWMNCSRRPVRSTWTSTLDDASQTLPPGVRGWDGSPPLRALIASCDRDQRLYLRARLALAELTQVDEAETGRRRRSRWPAPIRTAWRWWTSGCPTWMAGRCCGRCMRRGRPLPI